MSTVKTQRVLTFVWNWQNYGQRTSYEYPGEVAPPPLPPSMPAYDDGMYASCLHYVSQPAAWLTPARAHHLIHVHAWQTHTHARVGKVTSMLISLPHRRARDADVYPWRTRSPRHRRQRRTATAPRHRQRRGVTAPRPRQPRTEARPSPCQRNACAAGGTPANTSPWPGAGTRTKTKWRCARTRW